MLAKESAAIMVTSTFFIFMVTPPDGCEVMESISTI